MENKLYLGDGVYGIFDGYHIHLAVNNHENVVVVLEPEVLEQLIQFANNKFNTNYKNVKDE